MAFYYPPTVPKLFVTFGKVSISLPCCHIWDFITCKIPFIKLILNTCDEFQTCMNNLSLPSHIHVYATKIRSTDLSTTISIFCK